MRLSVLVCALVCATAVSAAVTFPRGDRFSAQWVKGDRSAADMQHTLT